MKTVLRHSLTVRVTHWLIALSGILLLFSGFGQMPMYKRYNVVKIPGLGWSDNFEITLLLHYIGALFFTAGIAFHLMYHWKRKEFGIVPQKGDIGESIKGLLSMVGLAEEPSHGKFQAKQRVIYAVFGSTGLILVATGLVKSYKNLGAIIVDPMFLQFVAFTHTIAGMLFMVLFLAHVAALLLYRPLIPSMFTGRIDREYVKKHHSEWKVE
ncbi:formate dehydrogenase subunit gamma [Desulfopila sp. IMCC35008]|uniref:formate dehydrogenase subunit gamma n=1 Tax=Desulfopila sp. IMCC35008 TaxID=2653858 RepID=UPI0013D66996|nr:cytochrome b/b6 domain-containing protein [Desulfopila sp. IMCC35008]